MKKTIFLLSLGALVLTGCPKHEIIPAPTPKIELSGHLEGVINGTSIELTENVGGYFVDATKAKVVLSSPQPSTAVYYSEMKSSQSTVSVRIGMGSILWDASVATDPSINQFNDFFNAPANLEPLYSDGAAAGFEVVYRDGSGKVWTSEESNPGTVIFNNITQEADATGDYSKFVCTFSTTVHRTQINPSPQPPTELYLDLEDIVFEGWFKR